MKIENIVFVVLTAVAIVLALWFLFGHSPTIEQVIVGLVAANLGFSFKIHGDLQRHMGEHKGYNHAKSHPQSG